jgi:phage-related baseplate assembly protein
MLYNESKHNILAYQGKDNKQPDLWTNESGTEQVWNLWKKDTYHVVIISTHKWQHCDPRVMKVLKSSLKIFT